VEYFPLILLSFFALYLVISPLTVWFHELGHAIPAMLASGKEVTIYIGSYGNEKNSFNISWRKMNMWVQPGIRKRGLCIYPEGLSLKMLIISTLCGPLASLIVGLFTCYLIFSLNAHGLVKLIAVVFMISATVDLFVNLFPRKVQLDFTGGTTYNDGYIIFHLIRYGQMPALQFTIDENGFIDPDEADDFLAHYSEVKFDAAFYRHLIKANIHKNRNNRALELHTVLSQKYDLTADDYCNLGIIYGSLRMDTESLEAFETALSMDNGHVYSLANRGYFGYINGQYTSAREDLDKAISINPAFATAYGFRSILSLRTEQLSDALSYADKAISLEPDNVFGHFALGLFYIENNEKQKALSHLGRAGKQRSTIYWYEETLARANALKN
jgi:Flp pilus assembly protein TadD